ncbi:TPA: ash family protein [Enterobacter cloacae]|nr:ash family protein [Enterobacter cloacae]
MVAQAGPTTVGPVSIGIGVENPVWATTLIEILNSGGSTHFPMEYVSCSNTDSRRSAAPIKNPISTTFPPLLRPSVKPVASSPAVLSSFCQPVSRLMR